MAFAVDGTAEPRDEELSGVTRHLRALVHSPHFESFFAVLILLNTILITLEFQYQGHKSGAIAEYPGYDKFEPDDIWPRAAKSFAFFEAVFAIMFVLELVVKIVALRWDFVQQVWNWIDALLVLSWFSDFADIVNLGVNVLFLRTLRLLRIFRMVRLVRSLKDFDSLFLMLTAMRGSFTVLFWALSLLLIAQTIIALIIQQLCQPFIEDTTVGLEERQLVFRYYGTFTRSTITMFEITLGNWIVPCRVLMDTVHEAFSYFGL